jgi:hypothetical protein
LPPFLTPSSPSDTKSTSESLCESSLLELDSALSSSRAVRLCQSHAPGLLTRSSCKCTCLGPSWTERQAGMMVHSAIGCCTKNIARLGSKQEAHWAKYHSNPKDPPHCCDLRQRAML